MSLNKIVKHKSYIFFTFFKYVEYGVLAFIFMSFANLVSPDEYGEASLGFQVITYSGFIVLGVNQVLLKRYSLEEDERLKLFYMQYNVLFNFIACIISVCIIWVVFFNKTYVLSLALICGLKLILESSVAINRVRGKMAKINTIYLSYSLLFLALYFINVTDVVTFFRNWSFSVIFGATIGFVISIVVIFKQFNYLEFRDNLKQKSNLLFKDGIKLAVLGAITPLFSTLNIIFLNAFDIDETVIGNFQLADNIANLVSLGGASILFIVFPDVIKIISKDKSKIKQFYKTGIKIIIISIIALIALYYPLKELLVYFFPEYVKLPYLIVFTLISRLLILLLFIPNSAWITFSKETAYIKVSFVTVFLMGVAFFIFLKMANTADIYNHYLFFQIAAILILHVYFRRKIYSI